MSTSRLRGGRTLGGRLAQAFDLGGITNTVGAPFFAHSAKGGSRECPARRGLITLPVLETRFSSGPHSLAPARLRPAGRTDNCSSAIAPARSPNPLHRIAVHIPQPFHPLLCRPHLEVVEPSLPESPALSRVVKQVALARVPASVLGQQGPRRALLYHLHHGGRSSDFWFRDQQVDVLRHDDVPDDHEPVALAGLLQHGEEAITAERRAQKRQSPVTRTGDKVQVMSAVGAMQAAGHDKTHRTGSIVPAPSASSGQALAKNARTGHPRFRNGKENRYQEGRATLPTGATRSAQASGA